MSSGDSLSVSGVGKRYGDGERAVEILRGVDLSADPGQTIAIVGPSGSGKSTLLNIIGSLDQPTEGTVRLGEIEVTKLAGKALADFRARRVGFIFQDHHLLPQLTAQENVLLPTLAAGNHGNSNAADLLKSVGVAHRAGAFPSQMSGGERQRVAIARAMVNGARLLLCDEPTGNLDRDTGSSIIGLFLELAQAGVTVLMVTHNLEHARRFARCMELREGRLLPLGASAGGAA